MTPNQPKPEPTQGEKAARKKDRASLVDHTPDNELPELIKKLKADEVRMAQEAADELTKALREILRRLADKNARKHYGDEVAERLRLWAGSTRIEGFKEWLTATGWAALYADPKHAAKVEAAFIETWKARGGAGVYVFIDKVSGVDEWSLRIKESLDQGNQTETPNPLRAIVGAIKTDTLPITYAAAFMTVPRSAAIPTPEKLPRTSRTMHALDGLKCLFDGVEYDQLQTLLINTDWLRLLAVPWIKERLEAELELAKRQAAAADLAKAPSVHVKGRRWARLDKIAAGASWAFGGAGVEFARVKVDGREYMPAPDLAIVPAGYSLLPADYMNKAHQTLLPLDVSGGMDAPPLPVAVADATQYAITPAGGKLALVILAAGTGKKTAMHKTSLRELATTLNPNALLRPTHYETICKGLVQLDRLRLVLPNGMAYRVFESPIPWRTITPEEYDQPLYVGLSKTFEATLATITESAGSSYRGDFLFDLTGTMQLDTRRGGLLRQYIRAAAWWNSYWKAGTAGEPDPARLPVVNAERWAAMTNYLPPAAVEYLQSKGKRGDRHKLSHKLKELLADAEELEAAGLVKIDKATRKAVRLLPPPEYLEAWHESRKGAHKIPKT